MTFSRIFLWPSCNKNLLALIKINPWYIKAPVFEKHTQTHLPLLCCPRFGHLFSESVKHAALLFLPIQPLLLSHLCPFLSLCLSIFASLQVLVAFISFSETMLLVYLSYKVSQTTRAHGFITSTLWVPLGFKEVYNTWRELSVSVSISVHYNASCKHILAFKSPAWLSFSQKTHLLLNERQRRNRLC